MGIRGRLPKWEARILSPNRVITSQTSLLLFATSSPSLSSLQVSLLSSFHILYDSALLLTCPSHFHYPSSHHIPPQ